MKNTVTHGRGDSAARSPYQPKTGQRCHCRKGIERDNCPSCEGTGWQIDFAAIRARRAVAGNVILEALAVLMIFAMGAFLLAL
jgi:hypothetical protein